MRNRRTQKIIKAFVAFVFAFYQCAAPAFAGGYTSQPWYSFLGSGISDPASQADPDGGAVSVYSFSKSYPISGIDITGSQTDTSIDFSLTMPAYDGSSAGSIDAVIDDCDFHVSDTGNPVLSITESLWLPKSATNVTVTAQTTGGKEVDPVHYSVYMPQSQADAPEASQAISLTDFDSYQLLELHINPFSFDDAAQAVVFAGNIDVHVAWDEDPTIPVPTSVQDFSSLFADSAPDLLNSLVIDESLLEPVYVSSFASSGTPLVAPSGQDQGAGSTPDTSTPPSLIATLADSDGDGVNWPPELPDPYLTSYIKFHNYYLINWESETNETRNFRLSATDEDGDDLTYEITDPPAHGEIINETQEGNIYVFDYRLTDEDFGKTDFTEDTCTDSFKFRAYDGEAYSNKSTINLIVRPEAKGLDGEFTVTRGRWIHDIDLELLMDSPVGDTFLMYTIVDGPKDAAGITRGSHTQRQTLYGNGWDPDPGDPFLYLNYGAPGDWVGEVYIKHKAEEKHFNGPENYDRIVPGTITILVVDDDGDLDMSTTNEQPSMQVTNMATGYTAVHTDEDTPVTIKVEVSDPDGPGPYTYEVKMGDGSSEYAGAIGSVSPESGSVDSSTMEFELVYTPDEDENGSDCFRIFVDDGYPEAGTSDIQGERLVSVSVNPVADGGDTAPIVDLIPSTTTVIETSVGLSTNKDEPLTIDIYAYDPEGDTVYFEMFIKPQHGSVDSIQFPHALVYTPEEGYTGVDGFRFKVSDTLTKSKDAIVTIVVEDNTPGNKMPTASNDSYTVIVNRPENIALFAYDADDPSDVIGENLQYEIVADPQHGTLSSVSANNKYQTYTPDSGYTGTDEFQFRASDGIADSNAATVHIDVIDGGAGNNPPKAYDSTAEVVENTSGTFVLEAFDSDGDTLIYKVKTGKGLQHKKSLDTSDLPLVTYTPVDDFTGTDELYFTVTDGAVESAEAVVTINVVEGSTSPTDGGDGSGDGDGTTHDPSTGVPPIDQIPDIHLELDVDDMKDIELDSYTTDPDLIWTVDPTTYVEVDAELIDMGWNCVFLTASEAARNTGWEGVEIVTFRATDALGNENYVEVKVTIGDPGAGDPPSDPGAGDPPSDPGAGDPPSDPGAGDPGDGSTASPEYSSSDISQLLSQQRKCDKTIPSYLDRSEDPWLGEAVSDPQPGSGTAQDATIPTTPVNITAEGESMHVALVSWDESEDPESGIDHYVFAVGTTDGASDVRGWQKVYRNKAAFYPLEDSLTETDSYYVSVMACNGEGEYSQVGNASAPLILTTDTIGEISNAMQVSLADYGFEADGVTKTAGWTDTEKNTLQDFTGRVIPLIKEVYGSPARDFTVSIVKNARYAENAVYFPQYNEVHLSDPSEYQLLTRELIHAFRDNVQLTTDANWKYEVSLSAFEEGFAQAASYTVLNKYIEIYPDDTLVNSEQVWMSDRVWDYDFHNVPELTTQDLYSDMGYTGLFWNRYEMASAAMKKIEIEDEDFFLKFNEQWYYNVNGDSSLRSSREETISDIRSAVAEIEGKSTSDWISDQRIFGCVVSRGEKIFSDTVHDVAAADYEIEQNIYFYETFDNGSDYEDEANSDLYEKNGSTGKARLYDLDDALIAEVDLKIEPQDNPPAYEGIGYAEMGLSTAQVSDPEWIGGLTALGLYRLEVEFGSVTKSAYRILGQDISSSSGIWGGIIGAKEGTIYLDLEGEEAEEGIPVQNGAFCADRSWAGVSSRSTGDLDTKEGIVVARFVDTDENEYETRVNIGRGSIKGNHVFLLDLNDMEPVEEYIEGPTANFHTEPAPSSAIATTPPTWILPKGVDIKFISSSTGTINSYAWQIGDTSYSAPTVTYKFTDGGTYDVSLSVSGPEGSDTMSIKVLIVDVTCELTTTPDPAEGPKPLDVTFENKSTGESIESAYLIIEGASRLVPIWDTNPDDDKDDNKYTHTFSEIGEYDVLLILMGKLGGEDILIDQEKVIVTVGHETGYGAAYFTATPDRGDFPLEVSFEAKPRKYPADGSGAVDEDPANILGYTWDFGAASGDITLKSGDTVNSKKPTVTYKKPGIYRVKLTVDHKDLTDDVISDPKIIHVTAFGGADFSMSKKDGLIPLEVKFTPVIDDAKVDTYTWDFDVDDIAASGDITLKSGDTTSSKEPTVTYKKAGKYKVSLTVKLKDSAHTDTVTKELTAWVSIESKGTIKGTIYDKASSKQAVTGAKVTLTITNGRLIPDTPGDPAPPLSDVKQLTSSESTFEYTDVKRFGGRAWYTYDLKVEKGTKSCLIENMTFDNFTDTLEYEIYLDDATFSQVGMPTTGGGGGTTLTVASEATIQAFLKDSSDAWQTSPTADSATSDTVVSIHKDEEVKFKNTSTGLIRGYSLIMQDTTPGTAQQILATSGQSWTNDKSAADYPLNVVHQFTECNKTYEVTLLLLIRKPGDSNDTALTSTKLTINVTNPGQDLPPVAAFEVYQNGVEINDGGDVLADKEVKFVDKTQNDANYWLWTDGGTEIMTVDASKTPPDPVIKEFTHTFTATGSHIIKLHVEKRIQGGVTFQDEASMTLNVLPSYKLTVKSGKITKIGNADITDGRTEDFVKENEIVEITADAPADTAKPFTHWTANPADKIDDADTTDSVSLEDELKKDKATVKVKGDVTITAQYGDVTTHTVTIDGGEITSEQPPVSSLSFTSADYPDGKEIEITAGDPANFGKWIVQAGDPLEEVASVDDYVTPGIDADPQTFLNTTPTSIKVKQSCTIKAVPPTEPATVQVTMVNGAITHVDDNPVTIDTYPTTIGKGSTIIIAASLSADEVLKEWKVEPNTAVTWETPDGITDGTNAKATVSLDCTITAVPLKFHLVVENGVIDDDSGQTEGDFNPNETVNILAVDPDTTDADVFQSWTTTSPVITIDPDYVESESANITIGNADAVKANSSGTVTANYGAEASGQVTVEMLNGSITHVDGTELTEPVTDTTVDTHKIVTVEIEAADIPTGEDFSAWEVRNTDGSAADSMVYAGYLKDNPAHIMVHKSCKIEAVFENKPGVSTVAIDVVNGEITHVNGAGVTIDTYPTTIGKGSTITITANMPLGEVFGKWMIMAGDPLQEVSNLDMYITEYDLSSATGASMTVLESITIKAVQIALEVQNGYIGSDPQATTATLQEGDFVMLTADIPPGHRFLKWEVFLPDGVTKPGRTMDFATGEFGLSENAKIYVHNSCVIKAVFMEQVEVEVTNGDIYIRDSLADNPSTIDKDSEITIKIEEKDIPNDKEFDKWLVYDGDTLVETNVEAFVTGDLGKNPATDISIHKSCKITADFKTKQAPAGPVHVEVMDGTITAVSPAVGGLSLPATIVDMPSDSTITLQSTITSVSADKKIIWEVWDESGMGLADDTYFSGNLEVDPTDLTIYKSCFIMSMKVDKGSLSSGPESPVLTVADGNIYERFSSTNPMDCFEGQKVWIYATGSGTFSHWEADATIDVSSPFSPVTAVTVNGTGTVTAHYQVPVESFSVTVIEGTDPGDVFLTQCGYGDSIPISAKPDAGESFGHWEADSALLVLDDAYALDTTVQVFGSGTVTAVMGDGSGGGPIGITSGDSYHVDVYNTSDGSCVTMTLDEGEKADITAWVSYGYQFEYWDVYGSIEIGNRYSSSTWIKANGDGEVHAVYSGQSGYGGIIRR